MSCASSCKTQDHWTYGECLRSKNLGVMGLESTNPSFTHESQKAWDSELDAYQAAVKQGIQPSSTKRADIDAAVEASQRTGVAYDASDPSKTIAAAQAEG